jgi:hypothetical protein
MTTSKSFAANSNEPEGIGSTGSIQDLSWRRSAGGCTSLDSTLRRSTFVASIDLETPWLPVYLCQTSIPSSVTQLNFAKMLPDSRVRKTFQTWQLSPRKTCRSPVLKLWQSNPGLQCWSKDARGTARPCRTLRPSARPALGWSAGTAKAAMVKRAPPSHHRGLQCDGAGTARSPYGMRLSVWRTGSCAVPSPGRTSCARPHASRG